MQVNVEVQADVGKYLQLLSPYSLRQVSQSNLDHAYVASLAGQLAFGEPLPLPSKAGNYRQVATPTSLFQGFWG